LTRIQRNYMSMFSESNKELSIIANLRNFE